MLKMTGESEPESVPLSSKLVKVTIHFQYTIKFQHIPYGAEECFLNSSHIGLYAMLAGFT